MKKVVRMSAGLANRMLQYSYYLYLKKKGYDAYVDNNYKATEWKMEDIEWEKIFPNAPIKQASSSLIFRYGGGYGVLDKFRRHYLPFISSVWIKNDATDVPSEDSLSRNGYFIGVMQDAHIVEFVKDEVFECFKFPEFEDGTANAKLVKKMRSENSVSVHLRKGKDYLKNVAFHNTCTSDYYTKAINIIQTKVENPQFYIFTDNPDSVNDYIGDYDYTIVEGNPAIGWGNHFDMQLMSCCKHNIIANSTYSWWGAFLNPNPKKIVIDPRFWFNPEIDELRIRPNKTACEGWLLL